MSSKKQDRNRWQSPETKDIAIQQRQWKILMIFSLDWFVGENLNRKPMGFYHQIDRAFLQIFPSSNSMIFTIAHVDDPYCHVYL
jgi:hypothetical protein